MKENAKKLNIITVTPTFLPVVGGIELGLHEIYKRIGERHNVTIITPERPKHLIRNQNSGDDYHTDHYKILRFKDNFSNIRPLFLRKVLDITSIQYSKELKKLTNKNKCDVINFQCVFPEGLSLIYANRRLNIPTVLSLVGRSDVWKDYRLPQRLYASRVIKHADTIMPISEYCLSGYGNLSKSVTVPFGVDIHNFNPKKFSNKLRRKLGIKSDSTLIFTVQRLVPIKKVDTLIKVMSKVVKTHPEAVLIIGGQGEEHESLKRLTEDLDLEKNIKFAGYIPEDQLPVYYASSDIFAFHSTSETFGIVLAQAMSAGLPIVSIKSTCIPEVVHNNRNGLLVEPFDTDAFSKALIRLIEDKKLHKRISVENRHRAVREFDWNIIAKKYEQILLNSAERK